MLRVRNGRQQCRFRSLKSAHFCCPPVLPHQSQAQIGRLSGSPKLHSATHWGDRLRSSRDRDNLRRSSHTGATAGAAVTGATSASTTSAAATLLQVGGGTKLDPGLGIPAGRTVCTGGHNVATRRGTPASRTRCTGGLGSPRKLGVSTSALLFMSSSKQENTSKQAQRLSDSTNTNYSCAKKYLLAIIRTAAIILDIDLAQSNELLSSLSSG